MTTFSGEVHPLAASYPMMPTDELHALANDIAEHGLHLPIVLDKSGRLIDGRNRLEACDLAGVQPYFVEYDGDDAAYIVSANVHRRHLSTGQQAAGEALSLLAQGKRSDGRWEYGALPENPESRVSGKTWTDALRQCGVVADVDVSLLYDVLAGSATLDAAYKIADATRKQREWDAERTSILRDEASDLSRRVVDGEMTLSDAWAELQERRRAHQSAVDLARDSLRRIVLYLTSDGAAPDAYVERTYTAEVLHDFRPDQLDFAAEALGCIAMLARKTGDIK